MTGRSPGEEDAELAAALAGRSRGPLTTEQVMARLTAGGQEYRDFLHVGMICIMDALNEKRLAAEGDERLRMRAALDALEKHHRVDDWVIDLTRSHMANNRRDAHFTDGAKRWRERALQEYLTPDEDLGGVPGLSTTCPSLHGDPATHRAAVVRPQTSGLAHSGCPAALQQHSHLVFRVAKCPNAPQGIGDRG